MARTFDGAGDVINMSVGACGLTGAFTCVIIARKASNPANFMNLMTVHTSGGTSTFGLEIEDASSGNNLQVQVGATFRLSSFSVTAAEGYVLLAGGKASGTTTPRVHKYVYGTDTWTHENASGTAGNPASSAGGTVRFGLWETADDFNGDVAVAAIFDRNLTDAEVELLAFSLIHWHALAPVGMWVFDQAAVGNNIPDLTGGGANQTNITGTAVATTSVPLLSYGHDVLYTSSSASSGATDANITPSTVVGVGSIGSPTVQAGSGVAPSTVAGVGAIGSPTVRFGVAITPSVVAGVGAVGSPTVQAGSVVTATTVAGVGAVGTASVVTLNPATVAGVGSVGSPTIQAGSVVAATTVAGVGAVGSPTVRLSVAITPPTVAGVGAVGSPTVQAGSVVTPTTVAGVGSVGSPSLGGSVNIAPSVVAGVGLIGSPTIQAGSTPTPTTVAGAGLVGTATVQAGTAPTPTVVAGIGTIGSPTVQAGAVTTPGTVAGVGQVGVASPQAGVAVVVATLTGVAFIAAPIFPPQPGTVVGICTIPTPTVEAALPAPSTPSDRYVLVAPAVHIGDPAATYVAELNVAVAVSS